MKSGVKLILVSALLLVIFVAAPVSAEEPVVPTSVDQLTSTQLAKSVDHAQIMAELGEDYPVRLIVKVQTEPDFVGVANVTEAKQVDEMAKISAAQNNFMVEQQALVEDIVTFKYIPYVSVWVESEEEYAALLASYSVVGVVEDVPVPALEVSTAPTTMIEAVPHIAADYAHDLGYNGTGYTVAILDTGVDKDHLLLDGGKVVSEACYSTNNLTIPSISLCPSATSSSTAAGSAEPYVGVCPSGECDHGTHVAGIAAGDDDYYVDFSGIAPEAGIIAIQVFSRIENDSAIYCNGTAPCTLTFTTNQISALEHVYDLRGSFNIAAVNMSLGGGKYTSYCDSADIYKEALTTEINNLYSADIATVISAGNDEYTDGVSAPSCISTAITVGATYDTNDNIATFSNADSDLLDIWAPGTPIVSSVPTETWGIYGPAPMAETGGTSMSAPMVSGAFAVLKEAYPTYSVDLLWSVMQNTGVTVSDTRSGGDTVAPRLDFTDAVSATPYRLTEFGYGDGWLDPDTPRKVADVNGDGFNDLIGFAADGVYVALGKGHMFEDPVLWIAAFGSTAGGWDGSNSIRTMADVNGDGMADIVGFGSYGVIVSLSTGVSFAGPSYWIYGFGSDPAAGGWSSVDNNRVVSDVNGDGMADVVGYGLYGVLVSLSNGSGFDTATYWTMGYGKELGGWDGLQNPRTIADVNGDGCGDVVGFSNWGVLVSLSDACDGSPTDTFGAPAYWAYGYAYLLGNWDSTRHVRTFADVDGDGDDDLVGFGDNGVLVSQSNGSNALGGSSYWILGYGYVNGGWDVYQHPRTVADINGDGFDDVVGYATSGVLVSYADGNAFK